MTPTPTSKPPWRCNGRGLFVVFPGIVVLQLWTQCRSRHKVGAERLILIFRGDNMIRMRAIVCIGALALLCGCASSSDTVTGSYSSPLQYQSYTCQQLGEEAQRISAHVAQASGTQDQKRTNDALATTAAIIIFWPAAFLVGGNDQNTAELARLKGEFEAIEKASIQKNCGLQFQKAPPPPKAAANEAQTSNPYR